MRPLLDQVIRILKQNPQGSTMTRRHRQVALIQIAGMLYEQFRLEKLENFKAKHATYLIEEWKRQDNGKGNVHNNLSHLRWLLDKVGKRGLIPSSNRALGIASRDRQSRQGKIVDEGTLSTVLNGLNNAKIQAMVLLGRHFGMRFEEACLFRPYKDVRDSMAWLNRGTKGGRPRYVWIVTDTQRQVIEGLRGLIQNPDGCLIPTQLTFKQWKLCVYGELREAGLSRKNDVLFHDLRRTFAASEHDRLLGKGHTESEASKIVSKKLGHCRTDILGAYIDPKEGGPID